MESVLPIAARRSRTVRPLGAPDGRQEPVKDEDAAHPLASVWRPRLRDVVNALVQGRDDTWSTSVAQWMGNHWVVLVDLWTVESGKSDLVLSARAFEGEDGFRFEIDSVHVP